MMLRRRSNLPEDMEMDILLRLPVKSLLRFRCVSKSWCARFQNQLFITNHYVKQQTKTSNNNDYANVSILVSSRERVPKIPSFSLLDQRPSVKEIVHVPLPESFSALGHRVMGCNGLICLWYVNQITLWNPATREFKHLPESPNTPNGIFGECGFGFDSKTDNYKVVCIIDTYTDDNIIRLVDLYTLSTDSWREIRQLEFYDTSTNSWRDQPPELLVYNNPQLETYINGVFHWPSRSTVLECIIAFDMADELFSTLPLPFKVSSYYNDYWDLGLFNGSLAIFNYRNSSVGQSFDIWVMKEYGITESWTKQLTIGPFFEAYCPLGFWKNGTLFLKSVEKHDQLVLYDPNTQEFEKFQIYSYSLRAMKVVISVDSLVPINGRQEHEDERFIRLPTQMGDV